MSLDAPEQVESPVVRAIPRRYVALGLIVLAIILVGALVVIRNANQANTTSDVETIAPAPSSVMTPLTHAPTATATAVGVTAPGGPITPPSASQAWSATHNST